MKRKSKQDFDIVAVLKACAQKKDLCEGSRIHAYLMKKGLLENSPYLATALISMYAKCRAFPKAQKVLENLPTRDVIVWNALISGYAHEGQIYEALKCFEMMHNEGISPDTITFICILKACGKTKDVGTGIRIHAQIVSESFLIKDTVLGNTLVDMYVKCGLLNKAQEVLEELPVRDVVTWNILIAGYVQSQQCNKAMIIYEHLHGEGIYPDSITYILILKTCSSIGLLAKGEEIHEKVMQRRLLENDIVLGTALVDMYAKCGMLEKAHGVLEGLFARDSICWNALIIGYAQQGLDQNALNCFQQMQNEGLSPNGVTYLAILKACGNVRAIEKGKQIHDQIRSQNYLGKDIMVGNALVDMYAKCGVFDKAQEVLKGNSNCDVVAWCALITGYVQHGQSNEALDSFKRMQNAGLTPDAVTFICVLKACGSLGAIDEGKQIHDELVNKNLLEKSVAVGTALVDMYARCGVLDKARKVLEELHLRDVVAWSTLISGYAQQGQGHEALRCLRHMEAEGIAPDNITLLCVLSACAHSGLVDDTKRIFETMAVKYRIPPTVEHLNCMVIAFGCGGQFDEAISVMEVMPFLEYPAVWVSLLGACKKWGNVKLGRLAFDQAVQLESNSAAAYILIADIFAGAGMVDDAQKIESMMKLEHDCWEDRN
jgi:pentatricopeptide repeat protein